MKIRFHFLDMVRYSFLAVTAGLALASNAVVIPSTPLTTNVNVPPIVMLVAGKDHKMFYEAYNDAGDVDGDGVLDVRFKPSIKYYGLFDGGLCYTHNNMGDNTGLFEPYAAAATDGKCSGKWSGNWLNYMTTSRIDALRKVLYGGYREVDTKTETILRRAYIPHDAHSWGKEYTSEAVDGFKISDYTPLTQPSSGKRHFFGSLTANRSQSCATLNNCSNMPPLLRIRQNVGGDHRIWEWASKERPVLDSTLSTGNFPSGTGSQEDRAVRVKVCTTSFHTDCKLYPSGYYKPIGLLHDYGESDAMLFGLMTGSYDKHMSGGRLRKVVSSFKDEVKWATTGQFETDAKIVTTFNNLRIRGFNQSSSSSEYWKDSPYDASAKAPTEGQFVDWGNPIAEMMYEAERYFAGKKSATSAFMGSSTIDTAVGLSSVTWDDPYAADSAAKAPRCSRASFLTISDVYPSFDSDQLPGSKFISFSSDLTGLDVKTEGDTISAIDSSLTGIKFIGQSDATKDATPYDAAPTAKNVTSIGTVRGLAPGEPAKQGSYYSASVAYHAKRTDLRGDLTGTQNVDTFVVALTSPLPEIKAPLPNGKTITLVPFAKSVGGSGIEAAKTKYQPTNQIVDFYVTTIANSRGDKGSDYDISINGGRYQASFLINYEDVEQGGDHDMDAIAQYDVIANSDSTLSVKVTPTYQGGGMKQNMGYAISGTTHDGVYLVAQDETYPQNYFLNVPVGQIAAYCDDASPPAGCSQLPTIGNTIPTFTFTAGSSGSAAFLPDPLRVAAKWGGFRDKNGNNKPDTASEWDLNDDGVSDNYFLVQNPYKLKESLKNAFEAVLDADSSASSVVANSTSANSNSRVFQARFNSADWSGDLVAYPFDANGAISSTEEWNAKDKMFAPSLRKIYINGSAGAVEFKYDNLSTSNKSTLGSSNVVDYLRGDRTNELKVDGTGQFRKRNANTVLGDIVDSSPFYEATSNVIYVGANDGMLHAFKASNSGITGAAGTEVFGFIPREVLSKLKTLSDPGYEHTYFVDGDVVVSPATAATGNKNILAGTLGRGGRGLFALDVTHPDSFKESNFLWEYTPAGNSTAASDNDLGYILGRPTFMRMNSGKIAVVFGNGYNSTNQKAVLYIAQINADGSLDTANIKKIDTGVGADNGLSTPTGVDLDNTGTIDVIYAGDLKGNVWKFDVSGETASTWKNALGGSTPFFTALDSGGIAQPITAPITVETDNVSGDLNEGKHFIFFGTGSYFQSTDPSTTQTQTWYGLIDQSTAINSRSELRQRSISLVDEFADKPVRTFSVATTSDMIGKKGWYLDFTTHPKERFVTESLLLNLAKPVLAASSIIPDTSDSCVAGGGGFVNVIDPFTGGATTVGILDINGDGDFTNDMVGGSYIGSVDLGVGMPSRPSLIGNRLVVGGTSSDKEHRTDDVGTNPGAKATAIKGRISWREIILD